MIVHGGETVLSVCTHGEIFEDVVILGRDDPLVCRCRGDTACCGNQASEEDGFCNFCRHEVNVPFEDHHDRYLEFVS